MANPKIQTHYNRAVEVSRALLGMLEQKVYPFNQRNLFPDKMIPKGIGPGSQEHALMLFFACSLDSMDISERVYRRTRELVSQLDKANIDEISDTALTEIIRDIFGETMKTAIVDPFRTLAHNFSLLKKEYQGDPRNLKGERVEETIKNISKFYQYREEKSALLIKNYVRFGMWPFSEYEIPIKIDRHCMRISIGTRVIEFPEEIEIDYKDPIKPLRKLYQQVTQQERISAIKLDDAFWATGSKLCKPNSKSYCKGNCPMGCYIRPWLDKRTTYFHLKREMRRGDDSEALFPFKNG
jgi:hypothetical protein